MGILEVLNLLSCKDGDELFSDVQEILNRFDISMLNEDGSYKDTYTLLCEIAEVWNKEE